MTDEYMAGVRPPEPNTASMLHIPVPTGKHDLSSRASIIVHLKPPLEPHPTVHPLFPVKHTKPHSRALYAPRQLNILLPPL